MNQRPERTRGGTESQGNSSTSPVSRRLAWAVGIVVVLAGATAIAFSVVQPPPAELEGVETFPDLGVDHLAAGEPAPEYNSVPPTSGPHAEQPAPCGIYRQPVPDVSQLHSLEHGAVVVQYSPDLPRDQIEALEGIGRSMGDEVIVAPRPGSPAPVVLTAWTKRLLLDEVDESVVRGFDAEFGNRSPEPGAICPPEVDEGM